MQSKASGGRSEEEFALLQVIYVMGSYPFRFRFGVFTCEQTG